MSSLQSTLTTDAAWKGQAIKDKPESWVYTFSKSDISEINASISTFLDSNSPLEDISKNNFLLPELGKKLTKIKTDLTDGMGFKLFKGMDISSYNRKEIATLFMGVGSYLGTPRSQNAAGHLLGHVRDIGADENDPNSTIKNIQVFDSRFKTEKGLTTASTFKDVKANYTIDNIETTINAMVIFLKETDVYLTIDKKSLPEDLRYNLDLEVEASQIPDGAPIKYFMIGWEPSEKQTEKTAEN